MDHLFEDSIAMHFKENIDCRFLCLKCEFYDLSREEAVHLVEDVTKWLQDVITDETISVWKINDKKFQKKRVLDEAVRAVKERGFDSVRFEAYKCSNVITNKTSIRRYHSQILKYGVRPRNCSYELSIDYIPYWQVLFQEEGFSNEEIIRKMHQLCNEKGRYPITFSNAPDAQGILFLTPYKNNTSRLYGEFNLYFSAFSLGTQLVKMAEVFKNYIIHLSECYVKCNARVLLQPISAVMDGSAHRDLFGDHLYADGTHAEMGQSSWVWYSTYYMNGVEWANIISPKAKVHIKEALEGALLNPDVHCRELNGGGVFLQSLKPIDLYDVDDALLLKSIVSDALYPGTSGMPLRHMFSAIKNGFASTLPRSDWAIIPVFEDEIVIIGTRLVFRARNVLKENHHYIQ